MPATPRLRIAPDRFAPVRLAVVALLSLALAGCELTSVDIAGAEDVIVVEAYLRNDGRPQIAFLHRTLQDSGGQAVPGAQVRVTGPDGVVHEYLPTADRYCIPSDTTDITSELGSCYRSADSAWVEPGGTYDLAVTLPDVRRIAGRVTVPTAFEILRPAADTCALEGPYELIWSRSEGTWVYLTEANLTNLAPGLTELGVEDPPDSLSLLGLAISAADTTMLLPTEFGVFDRFDLERDLLLALQQGLPDGATAEVVVAAAERNYVNWVRGGNFNPSGQVRVPSVTGDGTGVFGAVVIQRRVFLGGAGSGLPVCE